MARIVVRHSELKDFRQCPLKHRFRWVDGWQNPDQSDASKLGTAWHLVLQAHYEAIKEHQTNIGYEQWRLLISSRDDDLYDEVETTGQQAQVDAARDLELSHEQQDTLAWMYEGYLEQHDLDPNWEVLMTETDLTVPFVEPSGRKSRRFAYQFHADLVVRDHSQGGYVLVVDHKSTSQPLGQHDVDLDDQFGLYTWALSQLGHKVLAPVCNQAKTAKLKRAMTLEERFARINSFRTAVEQTNIAADALRTAKAAYGHANLTDPYSAPNPRTCGWSCDFKEVHLLTRKNSRGLDAAPAALLSRGFTKETDE